MTAPLPAASARVIEATAALNLAIEAAVAAGLRVEASVMDAATPDMRSRCPRVCTQTSIMLASPSWRYPTGDDRPAA